MSKEVLIIVLPLPSGILSPNCTIGSFGGRMMKANVIKKYRILAREAIEAEEVATAPWERAEMQATFYFACKRRRDEDNAEGSLKAARDGIVDAGLLADDDSKHLTRQAPIFDIDKIHPRVMLEITRIK